MFVLKDIEEEVRQQPRLRERFPWFEKDEYVEERLAGRVKFNKDEQLQFGIAAGVLRRIVQENISAFRNPPSLPDCRALALAQIRSGVVATDDLAMHKLAEMVDINVWHGCDLLRRMFSAKAISADSIREIFKALQENDDLPKTWEIYKTTHFKKVFSGVK